MHTPLFHKLLQCLLLLLFWLSFVGASPIPKSMPHGIYSHLQSQTRLPKVLSVPKEYDRLVPIVSRYGFEFKKYSNWIKGQSESLWKSRKGRHQAHNALQSYVSPYLTLFEVKKDGRWVLMDFEQSLKWFLMEGMPEWLGGTASAPREDIFLLRAMEQPSYMAAKDLPRTFRMHARVKEELGLLASD